MNSDPELCRRVAEHEAFEFVVGDVRHSLSWCPVCADVAVTCGICGNQCCNGATGQSRGIHPTCECGDAYEMQLVIDTAFKLYVSHGQLVANLADA